MQNTLLRKDIIDYERFIEQKLHLSTKKTSLFRVQVGALKVDFSRQVEIGAVLLRCADFIHQHFGHDGGLWRAVIYYHSTTTTRTTKSSFSLIIVIF